MKTLICIVGPTASGKTSLAISIAKHYQTEILSADSRQFFREMEIGTAKPTSEELSQVPHHFVNNKSILEEYDAGTYAEEALALLNKLFEEHEVVVLCGGSGLYIKAVCEGFDEIPQVPEAIRQKLNSELENSGLSNLVEKLEQIDPDYYNLVDKNNPQRVIRALEVFEATGLPYSSFRKSEKKVRPFRTIKIGLDLPREELYERIDTRMDVMLSQGLLEEVQSLVKYSHINALQTVGYSEIFDFLDGKYDWNECVRLLKQNSRRYAKRQLTWFKRDVTTHWFNPKNEGEIFRFLDSEC